MNHSQRQLAQLRQLDASFGTVAPPDLIQRKSIVEAVGRAGTDKIAVAGEIHEEIDKAAERRFWQAEGTKVVYENQVHNLKSPESDELPVPMTFDDCNERALYEGETLVEWIKDFDYRKKGFSKGKKCEGAAELKRLIVSYEDMLTTKVDTAKIELKNMIGFNSEWAKRKLPPRYSQAQIAATSDFINYVSGLAAKCMKTLRYEYVATDDLVAGLRIKRVGEYIDEAEAYFFKAKALANVDKTRLMSVARSETMYINLRELGELVSEKSVYKVGNKHAADMRKIPDPPLEIKSRDEYLAETKLIEAPPAEVVTRPPAEDMLGGSLIKEKEKKASRIKGQLNDL